MTDQYRDSRRKSNRRTIFRRMSKSRPPSVPMQILVALLYGASAAHASFVVGLMWIRPGMDMGTVAGLLFLPFFFMLLAFVPVVLALMALRLALKRFTPGFVGDSMIGTVLLSLIGLGLALAFAFALTGWLERDSDVYSATMLGAAIGGIVSGFMVGTRGRIDSPTEQP
jgi:hypothetical protein